MNRIKINILIILSQVTAFNQITAPNPTYNSEQTYYHNPNIIKSHKNNSAGVFAIIILIIGIISAITASNKMFKEAVNEYRGDKVFFSDKYTVEPPSNMSPAVISYILNKDIKINDIVATLIDLHLMGILASDYDISSNHDVKDNLNYSFKINYDKTSLCSPQEEFLIKWLSSYGYKLGYFTLQDIEDATKSTSDINVFKDNFNKWSDLINKEVSSMDIYTKIKGRTVVCNEYYNEYLKWKAFKNYLENYKRENNSVIYDENYWKRLLPYVICFNVANDLIEFAPNLSSNTYNYYDPLLYNPNYMNYFFYDFINSVESNLTPPSDSNNFNDNNFGDGGGFTSGGDSSSCGGGGGSDAF